MTPFKCQVIFLDDAASRHGFVLSPTLPYPKNYKVANQNPILECLADQMAREGWKIRGSNLQNNIIAALRQGTIKWPYHMNKIITQEKWNRLMEKDLAYYRNTTNNPNEFFGHEAVLLDLASQYLKRRITLIPFIEGDEKQTFVPKELCEANNEGSKNSTYYLLCCYKAYLDNFFISIFPN